MALTIEERSREKYLARERKGMAGREDIREERSRRITGRRPIDRERLEQDKRRRIQEKAKADLKKKIALETSRRKAAKRIKEAEEKGLLSREEAEKARTLERAKERLRHAIMAGLLKERVPGEQAARSQKRAYENMMGGHIDRAIGEAGQSFQEGAVGNAISGNNGQIAEALRDIKKVAGRNADSVMQSMLRSAIPGPGAKLDTHFDEKKRDANKEGKQTEEATRTQVQRERQRREREVVRTGPNRARNPRDRGGR